jgi:DNA repair protein RAD50
LHDKIRTSESAFDSISSVAVEIELLEAKVAEAEEQKARLEHDIRDAKYDEQIRDKAGDIRQKEAEKDRISAELSALNRQADSRAQLAIKRGELTSKNNQIQASYV